MLVTIFAIILLVTITSITSFTFVSKISFNIISKIAIISAAIDFVILNEITIYDNYLEIKVVINKFSML